MIITLTEKEKKGNEEKGIPSEGSVLARARGRAAKIKENEKNSARRREKGKRVSAIVITGVKTQERGSGEEENMHE